MIPVIAIASIIGGGKTSLARSICRKLPDATAIHFDSYEKATGRSFEDIRRWMQDGADFNQLQCPGLVEALEELKSGRPVVDPLTGRHIPPGDRIIFEMPLGREHKQTKGFIDLLVWIDIPRDIALARKLIQHSGACPPSEFSGWIRGYLETYLSGLRELMEIQKQRVSPDADIVIDGTEGLEAMTQKAVSQILKKISG